MKLKSLLFGLSFLLISSSLIAQEYSEYRKPQIGISFSSFGKSESIHFKNVDGAGSFETKDFYTLGVNYLFPVNRAFSLEVGVEYSKQNTVFSYPGPGIIPSKVSLDLISIPVSMHFNFLNYFFLNGGLFLGIQANKSDLIDNQSGVGGNLGAGLKYDFENGISIYGNPYLKIHSVIPFSSGGNHQRLMENGLRFGVRYGF